MKLLFISFCILFSVAAFGQSPSPLASPPPVAVVAVVEEEKPPVVEAPPEWLVKSLTYIYEIPVVGPYASKGAQWLGVVVVILTSFTTAILVSLRALSTVLSLAGILTAVTAIQGFENSKVMYWLKYFSMFNAQKNK
jgi:hypothetical protein